MENAAILHIQNLVRRYPGLQTINAVDDVSFEVQRGDFVALTGPSGSGKTSLLNLCSGLDRPTSGSVTIDGREINLLSNSELSHFRANHIGFVFQAYNLIPVLTVVENIEYTLVIRGEDRKRSRAKALNALASVNLEGKGDRYPNQLSGGQQQRVAVARALACDPKIIFADEPTANLDSTTAVQLISLFQDLNVKKNVTFLFSTHDSKLYQNVNKKIEIQDGKILNISQSKYQTPVLQKIAG